MASGERRTWAIIAGGGTAGHVQPGVDIGRALVARGHPPESIHYVGTNRGIEARLIPAAGFGLTCLKGRGFVRRLSLSSVTSAWALCGAVVKSFAIVARRRPAVVATLGGYAGFGPALAAAVLRVPVVVVEQNAVPGLANRLMARVARASAVAYEGTPLPRARVTGNPVREEILSVNRDTDRGDARQQLGLPDNRHVVAIFGGSLGARRINLATLEAVEIWERRDDLAVHHVVGERDWEVVTTSRPELPDGGVMYQAVRYEDRMHLVLAAADLAVCRAGGTTVAELAAAGLPSVLVPLPGAPGDHQTANAGVLERAGGAVVVRDAELDGRRLATEVDSLLAAPDRLATMGRKVAGCAHRDAAARVAALIEEHARRG